MQRAQGRAQHSPQAQAQRAPLTTRKLETPPKPRTQKWPLWAAPAASAAASKHREKHKSAVVRGSGRGTASGAGVGALRPGAVGRSAAGRRCCAPAGSMPTLIVKRKLPPRWGGSTRLGLEPKPRRHDTRARHAAQLSSRAGSLDYGESDDPAKTTYSRMAFLSRPCSSCSCQQKARAHKHAVGLCAQAGSSSSSCASGDASGERRWRRCAPARCRRPS